MDRIKNIIRENILLKETILNNDEFIDKISKFHEICLNCILNGGKILACGNGGSAADASHFVTELMGKFSLSRNPYPTISLNSDNVLLTALANDYQYCEVFSRQISALMVPEDVLLAISTSGASANIIKAIKNANKIGGKTILLTSDLCKKTNYTSNLILSIPSKSIPRIQECHTMILHIICEMLEKDLYSLHFIGKNHKHF